MDDFTKNLTRVNEAHIKVEIDVSKPLPFVLELERENGHVDLVEVDYPWIPPTCTNYKEICHIQKNCHKLTPTRVPKAPTTTSHETTSTSVQKKIMSSSATSSLCDSIPTSQFVEAFHSAVATPVTPLKSGVPTPIHIEVVASPLCIVKSAPAVATDVEVSSPNASMNTAGSLLDELDTVVAGLLLILLFWPTLSPILLTLLLSQLFHILLVSLSTLVPSLVYLM